MDDQAPPPPPAPGLPEDEEPAGVIEKAAMAGGVVLLLGMGAIFMLSPPVEPQAATADAAESRPANRWPSKKDLGLSDEKYTPKREAKPKREVKRTGTPFGDDSNSFFINTPSFGKLKTRFDWEQEEARLQSEGTPKATWQLAHLYASGRNPYRHYGQAISALESALASGAGVAAYDLALCYDTGRWDQEKDKAAAKRYYQIALEHGITNASSSLDRLEKEGF